MQYREEQRYRDYLVYIVLLVLGGLVISRVVEAIRGEPLDIISIVAIVGYLGLAGFGIWYLSRLRFVVRVNEKNLKLSYAPFHIGTRKIKWKHVKDIALIRTPKFFKLNGMNVHFTQDYRYYDLNGRGLMRLVLDNDEVVCVGVKKMKGMRKALDQLGDVSKHVSYREMDLRHQTEGADR